MTKLYLARHGETFDNAAQIMQGQTQGRLNAAGIRQGEMLRDRMKDVSIDAFVSSDLYRSFQMCQLIAEPHHRQVMKTALLRERDWGDFTGKYIPDLQGKPFPQNVETIEQMKERARAFLAWINEYFEHQIVLAVGHGIINKTIQSVFFDLPMNEIQPMTNAEVRILTW